jgi:hypothetical protein
MQQLQVHAQYARLVSFLTHLHRHSATRVVQVNFLVLPMALLAKIAALVHILTSPAQPRVLHAYQAFLQTPLE